MLLHLVLQASITRNPRMFHAAFVAAGLEVSVCSPVGLTGVSHPFRGVRPQGCQCWVHEQWRLVGLMRAMPQLAGTFV